MKNKKELEEKLNNDLKNMFDTSWVDFREVRKLINDYCINVCVLQKIECLDSFDLIDIGGGDIRISSLSIENCKNVCDE